MTSFVAERIYPEIHFGKFTFNDGGVPYYARVQSLLNTSSVVLDYGCGRGIHLSSSTAFYKSLCTFKGKVRQVIGVDPTGAGVDNLDIDEFRQMTDYLIPVEDGTIDLCHADWVIEHVTDIDLLMTEINRVLKPGGYFCFRTPNRFHYSSLGAAMIPFELHYKLRGLLGDVHEAQDVFPTTYPCNTKWSAERILKRYCFTSAVRYHRGISHLMGMGYLPGLIGKFFESISPRFLCHELHVFAQKMNR